MKSILSTLVVLTFLNSANAQKIHTSDIANFWTAYDSLQNPGNGKSDILKKLFLNKKTDGLAAFMEIRNFNETDYLDVIEKYPKFWNSIRPHTIIDNKKIETINKALRKLKMLYPNNSNGAIYYTIGALKSGGTTHNEDLLLGIEKIVGDNTTIVSEFENESLQKMFRFTNASRLEQITIHELVHTFQKEGEINILSKAIKEGSCDFIAELALDKKFTSPYIDYGYKNHEAIRSDFKKEMLSQRFGNWFYNGDRNENPDLGYFIGYVITKKYYENSINKKKAVKAIIELDFNDEFAVFQFLEASGYFDEKLNMDALKAQYKKNQPSVVQLIGFENGAQNVNPDLRQIQIVFSKPMNERISINFSKNGKEHFPLKNIIGLDKSKTILTVETIELSPNTEYDFYITDRGTQSIDGYPFFEQEYKITFKTNEN